MSTFLRYLRLQLQTFTCLGIGPLFLVIYFGADKPQPAWMLWWGIATASPVGYAAKSREIPTRGSCHPTRASDA